MREIFTVQTTLAEFRDDFPTMVQFLKVTRCPYYMPQPSDSPTSIYFYFINKRQRTNTMSCSSKLLSGVLINQKPDCCNGSVLWKGIKLLTSCQVQNCLEHVNFLRQSY